MPTGPTWPRSTTRSPRSPRSIKHLPEYEHESLDSRRAASPWGSSPTRPAHSLCSAASWTPSHPDPRTERVLQLTEGNLLGLDPVVTDADQRAHLDQVIRRGPPDPTSPWRPPDPALRRRKPAAALTAPARSTATTTAGCRPQVLRPSEQDREIVDARPDLRAPLVRPPRPRCDCDHIAPFDRPAASTCPKCNLAPLCRHHHRLKTHAGWRYWKVGPDTYLWTDPHGLLYLRTPDGTRQLD